MLTKKEERREKEKQVDIDFGEFVLTLKGDVPPKVVSLAKELAKHLGEFNFHLTGPHE